MFGRSGNSLNDLMAFFSCPGRPVSAQEFKLFWESCSESDRQYYKNAKI